MKIIFFFFIFGINFVILIKSQEDFHLFDLEECSYGKKFCILYPTGCLETKGLHCEHGASVRQVSYSTMEVELFTTKIKDKITNSWMGLGFRDKSNCLPYCEDCDKQSTDQCYENAPFIECATWGDETLMPALSYNKKEEGLYYVETDMGVLENMETFVNDTYLYCRMQQWIQGDAATANVKKYKDGGYVLIYSKQVEYAMMTTWGSTKETVNDLGNKTVFLEDSWTYSVDPYMFMMHIHATTTPKSTRIPPFLSSIIFLFVSFLLRF